MKYQLVGNKLHCGKEVFDLSTLESYAPDDQDFPDWSMFHRDDELTDWTIANCIYHGLRNLSQRSIKDDTLAITLERMMRLYVNGKEQNQVSTSVDISSEHGLERIRLIEESTRSLSQEAIDSKGGGVERQVVPTAKSLGLPSKFEF